ncbi:MAG: ABC transporter permease, partial [Nitrospiraceae bacterium]
IGYLAPVPRRMLARIRAPSSSGEENTTFCTAHHSSICCIADARAVAGGRTTPVLVSATIDVAGAILTESALSFLGFGVQPPYATWGNILADGKDFIFDAPWLFFLPGSAILIVVLAFNLVGEGLREALNPRLRAR